MSKAYNGAEPNFNYGAGGSGHGGQLVTGSKQDPSIELFAGGNGDGKKPPGNTGAGIKKPPGNTGGNGGGGEVPKPPGNEVVLADGSGNRPPDHPSDRTNNITENEFAAGLLIMVIAALVVFLVNKRKK